MWSFLKKKRADPDGEFAAHVERYQQALEERRFDDANLEVLHVFSLAEQHCEENPSPDHDLVVKGTLCLENADWQGAEAAYREILTLPDPNPMRISRTHMDLCCLLRLLNRDVEAIEHVPLATEAARRADSEMLLAFSLQGRTRCFLDQQDLEHAERAIEETLSILGSERMYDQVRARTLILRAECSLLSGKLDAVDPDLSNAMALLEPASGLFLAGGVHSDLAHWWSVTARLRAALGDFEGSITAWRNAVGKSKHVASLPHTENVYSKATVAFMLAGLAQSMQANNQDTEAVLMERATIVNALRLPAAVVLREPGDARR